MTYVEGSEFGQISSTKPKGFTNSIIQLLPNDATSQSTFITDLPFTLPSLSQYCLVNLELVYTLSSDQVTFSEVTDGLTLSTESSGLRVKIDTSSERLIKFSIAVEKYKDTTAISKSILVILPVISSW